MKREATVGAFNGTKGIERGKKKQKTNFAAKNPSGWVSMNSPCCKLSSDPSGSLQIRAQDQDISVRREECAKTGCLTGWCSCGFLAGTANVLSLHQKGEFTTMHDGSPGSEVWNPARPSGKAPVGHILNQSVPLWRSELQMCVDGADSRLCWKDKDWRRPFWVVGPFSICLRRASVRASLNVTMRRCFDWQKCDPVKTFFFVCLFDLSAKWTQSPQDWSNHRTHFCPTLTL